MLARLFVLIFLMGIVSAVDVDMDCPDEIYAMEEFECGIEVEDGEGKYDLKIEVDDERDSVLRVWDGKVWKSSYYYLKNFVKKSEDVTLMFEEDGRFDVVVKLRDGSYREEFDVGRIRVLASRGGPDDKESGVVETVVEASEESGVISLSTKSEVISLGGESSREDSEGEWDYVSKDELVVDWLPYSFCLFLIFLVGILIWSKGA